MILNFCAFFLITITILWIVSIFWAGHYDGEGAFFVTFFGALLIGLFGWGIAGHCSHAQEITRDVPAKVVVTDSSIILTVDDKPVKTLTDVANYNRYKGETNVTLRGDGYVDIYYNTNWNDFSQVISK